MDAAARRAQALRSAAIIERFRLPGFALYAPRRWALGVHQDVAAICAPAVGRGIITARYIKRELAQCTGADGYLRKIALALAALISPAGSLPLSPKTKPNTPSRFSISAVLRNAQRSTDP